MLFKFIVDTTKLQCQNSSKIITSDSIEYHIAEFVFDDTWDDYSKEATFTNTYTKQSVSMVLDNNNRCYIPQEALELQKDVNALLIVAVHGVGISNPNSEVWTKMKNPLTMFKSDKTDYKEHSEPTPSIYNQIISKLATKGDTVEFEDNTLVLKSDGVVVSSAEINVSGEGINYELLDNLPTLNDVIISGNKTNEDLGIPTKTSELDNDEGFISESQKATIDIDFSRFFE